MYKDITKCNEFSLCNGPIEGSKCEYYIGKQCYGFKNICKYSISGLDKVVCNNFIAWPDKYINNNFLYSSLAEYFIRYEL